MSLLDTEASRARTLHVLRVADELQHPGLLSPAEMATYYELHNVTKLEALTSQELKRLDWPFHAEGATLGERARVCLNLYAGRDVWMSMPRMRVLLAELMQLRDGDTTSTKVALGKL